MKYGMVLGSMLLLASGCVKEKYNPGNCREEVYFVMEQVPYIFEGEEAVGYAPYYTFTERLDAFVFSGQQLSRTLGYTYDYCRSHSVIPVDADIRASDFLLVANLYHPGDMTWEYGKQGLEATFYIRDYEEPPVYLARVVHREDGQDSVKVELEMLVAHLEIRLVDPPVWVTGVDVTVRDIAASVTTDHQLGDTTHIQKRMSFEHTGAGTYPLGVNAFPTYSGKAAALSVNLVGKLEVAPLIVEDSRLHLLPGVITRLQIVFDTAGKITVSVEIDGKWEVVEGGSIII